MKLCTSFLMMNDSIPRKAPKKNLPICAQITDMFKNAHCKCSPTWWETEKWISSIRVMEDYIAIKMNELRLYVSLRISTCTRSAALNTLDHSFFSNTPFMRLFIGIPHSPGFPPNSVVASCFLLVSLAGSLKRKTSHLSTGIGRARAYGHLSSPYWVPRRLHAAAWL